MLQNKMYVCNDVSAYEDSRDQGIWRGEKTPTCTPKTLDGPIATRQSLVSIERGQLLQAIPQLHVERILHQWTPIARFESQRNERKVYEDQILLFVGGDMTANERYPKGPKMETREKNSDTAA